MKKALTAEILKVKLALRKKPKNRVPLATEIHRQG
jgi:hypothetical protein